MSAAKESDSYQAVPNYRPEIGVDIWNGHITFDPFYEPNDEWHEFAQMVIDESQQPMWESYPNLPENALTTDVPTFAGSVWSKCRVNFRRFIMIPNTVKPVCNDHL